jgi:hypothetical protein
VRSNGAYKTINTVAFGHLTCPCVPSSEARAPPGLLEGSRGRLIFRTTRSTTRRGNDMQIDRLAVGMRSTRRRKIRETAMKASGMLRAMVCACAIPTQLVAATIRSGEKQAAASRTTPKVHGEKRMNSKHLSITTALFFMFVGAIGAAETKSTKFHCTTSGTFADGVETNIDTSGDGASATLDQGISNCTPTGRSFFQEESEWIPQAAPTTCPRGSLEFHIDEPTIGQTIGQNRTVTTDEKTGDQLFSRITSGTLCIDFSTFPAPTSASTHHEIIGGTGKLTGATGTYDSQTTGSYLMIGFKNGVFGGFGQFTGTSDGTVTVPKNNAE